LSLGDKFLDGTGALVATLPAQTRRFKLRISAILCKNSSDLFLDIKGCPGSQLRFVLGPVRDLCMRV
jgi:hypothetical protein